MLFPYCNAYKSLLFLNCMNAGVLGAGGGRESGGRSSNPEKIGQVCESVFNGGDLWPLWLLTQKTRARASHILKRIRRGSPSPVLEDQGLVWLPWPALEALNRRRECQMAQVKCVMEPHLDFCLLKRGLDRKLQQRKELEDFLKAILVFGN